MFRPAQSGRRTLIFIALLVTCAAYSTQAKITPPGNAAQADSVTRDTSPQLVELRRDLALRYLEPAPHMALAKYYVEQGNRLQAFYILEYARRARFPETEFNKSFLEFFGAPGPAGKQAEETFNRGAALQKVGKLAEAEAAFIKAAELAPRSVDVQAWTGRFFFKVKGDNQRALQYYLSAYLLSPDAYETEFVESRIRQISSEASEKRYRQLSQSGVPLEKMLSDLETGIVLNALSEMSAHWRPSYLKPLLELMGHDEEEVRWQATDAIMKHADRSFDSTLQALLKDSDLRKRGLAAYIAIHLWKQGSFDTLRAMLREDAQLLRFDALSALAMEGGSAGRQIMLEHRRHEMNPTLRTIIDSPSQ